MLETNEVDMLQALFIVDDRKIKTIFYRKNNGLVIATLNRNSSVHLPYLDLWVCVFLFDFSSLTLWPAISDGF